MLIIFILSLNLIFFIFKNYDCQGRCRQSPGAPQKTDVLRCARYLVTELSEIRKPKRFL